jgi:hypothetical protein
MTARSRPREGTLGVLDTATWQLIFLHVFDVAALGASPDEVAAEVLALARGDRNAIDTARVHVLGSIPDLGGDSAAAMAFLDSALKRGDQVGAWLPSDEDAFDPWVPARHHLSD